MHLGDAATLPLRYLAWHYSRGLREALSLWGRSFRFVTEFTAVRLHLRTFFAPFQRIEAHEGGGLEAWASSVAANAIMRLVGVLVRAATVLLALALYAAALAGGVAALVGWLFLPGMLAAIFSLGLYTVIGNRP